MIVQCWCRVFLAKKILDREARKAKLFQLYAHIEEKNATLVQRGVRALAARRAREPVSLSQRDEQTGAAKAEAAKRHQAAVQVQRLARGNLSRGTLPLPRASPPPLAVSEEEVRAPSVESSHEYHVQFRAI